MIRRNTSFVIASPSCAFSVWSWRAVPEAKTLWLYREALAKAAAVEELLDLFDGFLKDKGYLARGGQIIDASIVSAPKQHNLTFLRLSGHRIIKRLGALPVRG